MGYREESCGLPEFIGFKSRSAAGLDGQNSSCSGFGFDPGEEGEAVLPALRVHRDAGLRDGSEFWLPPEEWSREYIASTFVIFYREPHVPGRG